MPKGIGRVGEGGRAGETEAQAGRAAQNQIATGEGDLIVVRARIVGGVGANPGPTTFATVDGVAGNTAGNFTTSADAGGNVYLTFTPGVQAPPPVIDPTIVGAGTTSAQLSWSSVAGATYKVQYKTNISQIGWLDLTNLAATGTTTTIVDSTSPAPNERYYRVISP